MCECGVWMLWRFEQFAAFEKAEVQIQRDHDIKQRFVLPMATRLWQISIADSTTSALGPVRSSVSRD